MKLVRQKTNYAGVYFIMGTDAATGKTEKVYHIRYRTRRPNGGWTERTEAVGRQFRDNMTPAKASIIRARRMHGDEKPNKVRRAEIEAARRKRKWTVSALWEEYKQANPGLKGIIVYEAIYNAHVAPIFADKRPATITQFDIDRLKHRRMKGKSDKSIANALELLRRIVNFGVKRGLCQGPGFIIQLPRVNNQKTEDLTPEQMAKLLKVIDGHIKNQTPYRVGSCMMKLALYTGMRRSEMFRLKWDDIDWHRKNITLREAKSGRDEVIPLSSYAGNLLKVVQDVKESDSEFVFPGAGGSQRSSIQGQTGKLKVQAELPADFRPLHGNRHVFASMLVSNGVSLDVVSRLLTHKGQTVTHRYAHIRDDTLMAAAELAGRIVEEAATGNNVVKFKEAQTLD